MYSSIVFVPSPQNNPTYAPILKPQWAQALRSKLELFIKLTGVLNKQPERTQPSRQKQQLQSRTEKPPQRRKADPLSPPTPPPLISPPPSTESSPLTQLQPVHTQQPSEINTMSEEVGLAALESAPE